MNKCRKDRRHNKLYIEILLIFWGVLITTIFLLMLSRGYGTKQKDKYSETIVENTSKSYREINIDGARYKYNTDIIAILCMGIDSEENMLGQSDTILLLLLDRGEKRIKLINISRDSMVPVLVFDAIGNAIGHDIQQLALAYANGTTQEMGCMLMLDTVSNLLHDIPIIYYISGNISIISSLHDLTGDLVVKIPDSDLLYLDEKYQKGDELVLTKNNVELFLRSRNVEEDFTNEKRMVRQKVYIEAYLNRVKELLKSDFDKTVYDLGNLRELISTNITINELSVFAEMINKYSFDCDKDYFVLPGTNVKGNYHDEFYIDENELQKLVLDLFYVNTYRE